MTIEALTSKLSSYMPPAEIAQIQRAHQFAKAHHEGQFRQSGEPYINHPVAVAHILADLQMDHEGLMAAILHDVIEDTDATKEQLAEIFGDAVAELVDGVSKLNTLSFASKAEMQAESFMKMTMAMSKDIRVVMVKLADRLHNMRTLAVLAPNKKRRIATETLEIYAPLAQRMGINNFRLEFEELGFQAMHPFRYRCLKAKIEHSRQNRRHYVDEIQTYIETRLKKLGITASVIGREKHLWSIYQKMRSKPFSEIMDVFAFRIVTESVDDCYRVLGVIHNLFKPVAGEFKDYIAIPKANSYQSLHTDVVGTHGLPIEVQIRTVEMDTLADKGIAAHWLYKTESKQTEKSHTRANRWIKTLLELQQHSGNSLEFVEHVKTDLFPDEVYVFAPDGRIFELPKNATAVDFAYAIHTDIGNNCSGCIINNNMASLSEPLKSGQRVKILTSGSGQPNPEWLNFVVTAKARSAIRHYLKYQEHDESVALGKKLLNKALEKYGYSYKTLKMSHIKRVLEQTKLEKFEQVLVDIGLGNRVAFGVANILIPEDQRPNIALESSQQSIVVDTNDGMLVQFARCCHPLPGEEIAGHISPGKGLIVHLASCRNIDDIRDNPERLMPLVWSSNPQGDFQVHLQLMADDDPSMIARIAAVVAEKNAAISEIRSEPRLQARSLIHLTLDVQHRKHLADVIRGLKKLPFTHAIKRIKNLKKEKS